VKTGGRLVKHARCFSLTPAESHLTRRLFGATVVRIAAVPPAAGWREGGECSEIRRPGGRAGEVLVEVNENRQLPGFGFPGSAKLELGGAERRPQRKTALRSIRTRRA